MTNDEANTIDCWFCETCEKYNDYFFDNKNISVKDTLNLSQCSSMLEKKTHSLRLESSNMGNSITNNNPLTLSKTNDKSNGRNIRTKMLKDSDNESEDEKDDMDDNNTQTNCNTMHMDAKMDSMNLVNENDLTLPVKQSNKKIKGGDININLNNESDKGQDKENSLSPKKV